ncbi:putative secreted protein (Por secretion system target) [Winogradskyella epiphytica]|uniref:Putative secreted protein (Por secretion system target) n=1 Tax=Winogradskyella epiphytica TaxID=262005 RepID=A0A2V4XLK6_9FLAO|nr:M28 family peptidase [Winogradskyella epiphytica]PYE82959.1 putative secreted protein (Por secretion system target) [Winogradskyella epiphytica]GGW54828.1 hypothetical protein GCM10008085_02580 [Winogradskyella epiphytica]
MQTRQFYLVLFILIYCNFSHSQSIQDLMDQVSSANLELYVSELSGEQATIINGVSQTITSRVHTNNDLAANYIEERLSSFPNLSVAVQEFNETGKNIIATQLGKTNPDAIYMICAHYDSVTDYCADDNATGVSAVLEIARILSQQCTNTTIIYALWDEEEIGLLGSQFYAQGAADESNGRERDNILGVINMDMIGFDGDAPGTDGDNDFDIDVRNIANSIAIKDDLLDILNSYDFDLNVTVVNPGTLASDHAKFWAEDYSAVLIGESWSTDDQTPNYHTADDRVGDLDFQYMTELTKLVTAYVSTKSGLMALDNTVEQTSNQLVSNETGASYQWYHCDTNTLIEGETNRAFTPSADGNYAVEVSNSSCSEMSPCVAFSTMSISEFTSEELGVYPNPTTSIIKIYNKKNEELRITIKDISGKALHSLNSNKQRIEVNLNDQSAGIYFVSISSNLKSSTFKMVKE